MINTLPEALIRLDPKQLPRRTLDIQVKNTINETVRRAFPKICEPITTFRGLVKDLREAIVAHRVPVYIPPILSDSSIVVAKLRDLLSSDVFRGISYSIGGNGEYLGGYASDMDVIGDFGRSFSIRGGYFKGRRIFDGVGHRTVYQLSTSLVGEVEWRNTSSDSFSVLYYLLASWALAKQCVRSRKLITANSNRLNFTFLGPISAIICYNPGS
ncbi:hypothetical protein F5880DRAFT_287041 [Lentinula raphanica]|nr:hypothetical protein F5880DRAFT_287041 [Lentinula raphanica]